MPEFNTRTPPQEPNEPNKPRMALIASRLRTLLIANKRRIPLIANRVRSLLIANGLRTLLIGSGILLFAVAVTVGLLSQREAINEEPNGKKIALGIRRPGDSFQNDFDYALYVMNTKGSTLTQLADGADPAWSSDGEKIAFVRYLEEHADEDDSSTSSASVSLTDVPYIFVMNAEGSRPLDRPKRLLDRPAVYPTWSPDGEEIAFSDYRQDVKYDNEYGVYRDCSIYVMNADGSGEPKKLNTGRGCASSPSWSPDGNKIAYTKLGYEEDVGIYVVNVSHESSSNEPRPLTYSAGDPSWSPDSTEIAFTHEDETGTSTIYRMDADGSGEAPLTHNEQMEKLEVVDDEVVDEQVSPTWSPEGDQIAYVRVVPRCDYSCSRDPSYSYYSSEIYIMNSDGSNPTLVRNFGKHASLSGLDWQPLP